MKKSYLLLTILSYILLLSCSDTEEDVSINEDNTTQETYYYLQFQVTCYSQSDNSYQPVSLNVSLFNQKTKQRLVRGSTYINDGWFWATNRFKADDVLRIELWNYNNGCVTWVKDINPITNPTWFVTSQKELHTDSTVNNSGHFHLGYCKNSNDYDVDNDGVWGP